MRLQKTVVWAAMMCCTTVVRGEAIWIEGEHPSQNRCVRHSWYDGVDKSVMSGGQWLSHYDQTSIGKATYHFTVTNPSLYVLWLRCNPYRSQIALRLNDDPWMPIRFSSTRDRIMISSEPDYRYLAWVRVGQLPLSAGSHRMVFRFSSPIANHGGIDCFCLVDEPFIPSGTSRPGIGEPAGPSTWFPVVVDDDPHSNKSVTDMSNLIHRPAGRFGFLQRRNDRLLFEHTSRPVKFWGVGANVRGGQSRRRQAQRVRYLVKHGVNMVRQHSVFGFLGPLTAGRINAQRLDKYDWWFAQLKDLGLYTTWSVFYPLILAKDDGYDPALWSELKRGRTYGVVNFSRPLQNLQLRYLRALLNHHNPYTGLKYKDDPALAIIELQNEDCVFFHWPLNALASDQMPLHASMLRRMFCQWAKDRYHTDTALQRAWRTDETFTNGELRIHPAWQMTGQTPSPRIGDFIRFLTEIQRAFYERRERELRELGFRGVTITTAWRAGGSAANAANLYCDTAMDMIDRHNYFGGGEGKHRIDVGKVNNATHLSRAGAGILSIGMYQVENRPFAVTEWTQKPPNQWKAEIAPLMAFYGMGLQGWDASYHYLSDHWRIADGWSQRVPYSTDTPHYIGQFPALAFAIYKQHIREGPVAAARRLRTEQLFTGVDPLEHNFSGSGWDQTHAIGNLQTPLPVLAIGRVTIGFDGGVSQRLDWPRYWDRSRGIVRAATGDMEWDMKQRIVRVMSEKTQAVIGFAGGTVQQLPDVSVTITTDFVSLIFTPLDDLPLVRSSNILITATARDRQTGTIYSQDDSQLEVVGAPPLLLEPVQATVTLNGPPITYVHVLDVHGVTTGRHVSVRDNTFHLDGTHRSYLYQVLR